MPLLDAASEERTFLRLFNQESDAAGAVRCLNLVAEKSYGRRANRGEAKSYLVVSPGASQPCSLANVAKSVATCIS